MKLDKDILDKEIEHKPLMPEDNVIDTNKINEAQEAFDQADPNLEITILKHHFTFNFQEFNSSMQHKIWKQSEDIWETF